MLVLGRVVDNKDELNTGKILVEIPSLSFAPVPAYPIRADNYSFTVPEIDSTVLLFIPNPNDVNEVYYLGQAFHQTIKNFAENQNLLLYPLYDKKHEQKDLTYDPDNDKDQSRLKFLHRDEFVSCYIYSLPIKFTREKFDQPKTLNDFKQKTIEFGFVNRANHIYLQTKDTVTKLTFDLHAPYKKNEQNKFQTSNYQDDPANSQVLWEELLNTKKQANKKTVLKIYDSNNSIIQELDLTDQNAQYKLVLEHANTTVYIEAKNNGQIIVKAKSMLFKAKKITFDAQTVTFTGGVSISKKLSIADSIKLPPDEEK